LTLLAILSVSAGEEEHELKDEPHSADPTPGEDATPSADDLEKRYLRPARRNLVLATTFTVISGIVTLALTAAADNPGPLIVEGMLLALVWALAVLWSGERHLDLARALVDHGHTAPALRRLKHLQKGGGRFSDEATYLVAKVYDQNGERKLALASYREYLDVYDTRNPLKTRGSWINEAAVRAEELEAEGIRAPDRSLEVQAQATGKPELRCPFCKDDIGEEALSAECGDCATPHHLACYEEQGGCAVYGCRSNTLKTKVRE
jgi:hypothetical protein